MPETWMQVAVILTVVLPGFIYQGSLRSVGGPLPEEREFGIRILRAIAASAVFAGLYAVFLGPIVVRYVEEPFRALADVQWLGIVFLVLVVAVPWVAARAWFYGRTSHWFTRSSGWVLEHLKWRQQWNPTPSAWDFAFGKAQSGWVRVRLADGSFAGGWFSTKSYASSFPEPQELYLEVGYVMTDQGIFKDEVSAPGGMVVRCQDAIVVDFIPAESHNGSEEE